MAQAHARGPGLAARPFDFSFRAERLGRAARRLEGPRRIYPGYFKSGRALDFFFPGTALARPLFAAVAAQSPSSTGNAEIPHVHVYQLRLVYMNMANFCIS